MLASVNILTHGYVDRPIEPLTTIVFDVSRSMLAEDVLPSRIAVAKNALGDFLLGAKNRKINLIIFSGKPFLLVSHSSDTAGMLRLVRSITPYSILQEKPGLSGTNI